MHLEDLRLAVYTAFAERGAAPDPDVLAARLGVGPAAVQEGLQELAAQRHLVLDDSGQVVLAHPFSAIPMGFSVMGARTLWWGGCAWDSFALPHLLPDQAPVLVATRCPGCSTPLAWDVGVAEPPPGEQVAHFLVPAARIWEDVVHTCRHQSLFCSTACVDAWLVVSGNERGSTMDLATLWRLARGWYAGRLDRGYRRRDPGQAADYFRSVGLTGAFWGL